MSDGNELLTFLAETLREQSKRFHLEQAALNALPEIPTLKPITARVLTMADLDTQLEDQEAYFRIGLMEGSV